MFKLCQHFKKPGLCDYPGCANGGDKRDPVSRLFGGDGLPPDSAYAAKLHKEDPEQYRRLHDLAVERGRMPKRIVPSCLQDE